MHNYIYKYTLKRINTSIKTFLRIDKTYIGTHTKIHAYIHPCINIYILHIDTLKKHKHTYIHTDTLACTYTNIHIKVRRYTCIHTNTCIYLYIHIDKAYID